MDCYITYCVNGFLAFDENLKLIDKELFDGDKKAELLWKIENKELTSPEINLINKVSESYENISIETNKRISDYSSLNLSEKIIIEKPNKGGEYLRSHYEELGFSNRENIDTYKKLAIYKMKESSQNEDKHLIQAISSIDEIDESISKLIERIREWYALYFPEMDVIKNNETYIKLIHDNKTKEEIIKERPDAFLIDVDDFDEDIKEEDLEIINNFADSIYSLQQTRKNTENYIERKMESLAPNLKLLIGSSLGAKLISHSGGIKRLATYPSSTVQIMGAEKALFRHLKTGERPPKYGLIYQHPQVRGSNWWNRGKIARMLASKISLAVRMDVFGDKINPNIHEEFLQRVEEIEKEHPFPTKTTKRRNEERSKKTSKKSAKKRKRKRRK